MRNLADSGRATRLLLVDPNPVRRAVLADAVAASVQVDVCASFKAARRCLETVRYDLLVTAARLEEYNGIHLVYLAKYAHESTHAIVFDDRLDPGFAAEVRRASAFYEVAQRLAVTLPTYIGAPLPPVDRRAPTLPDRRAHPRGGRRRWDRHETHSETEGGETASLEG